MSLSGWQVSSNAMLNEREPRPCWSLNAWRISCSGRLAMRNQRGMWRSFTAVERVLNVGLC